MIGFNSLGRIGRLANQMFQYASLKGIARNVKADFCIPFHAKPIFDIAGNPVRSELFDSFNLNVKVSLVDGEDVIRVRERFFHFDDDLFRRCPKNADLHGYFQSEKYFKHIEEEIRTDFTFKDAILRACQEKVGRIQHPVALHVRRTDYVSDSANHPPCSMSYYEAALKHFEPDRRVIVFSDEPDWCIQQELFSGKRFLFSRNVDNRVDLCMMSLCDDFIIANSSYSWWAAWLSRNPNKKVIAPGRWFGTGRTMNHDTRDLIPQGWIAIDT